MNQMDQLILRLYGHLRYSLCILAEGDDLFVASVLIDQGPEFVSPPFSTEKEAVAAMLQHIENTGGPHEAIE